MNEHGVSAKERSPQMRGLSDRWRNVTGDGPADAHPTRLGPLVRGVKDRVERASPSALVPRKMRGFPFTKPTWPSNVPREPEDSTLGVDYDTDWARSPVARAARQVIIAGAMKPFVRAIASPDVRGLDRIEHLEGPVVFAANHHSHLDTMLLLSAIPADLREKTVVAAGADYFFDTKVKAAASALAMGAIPIERKKVSRRSSDQAQELLADGWSLVIFPEGGRSPDGWGQDWKPGAAFLAVRAACPVVPVHLEGTGRVLPKGRSRPKLGETVTVTFGHPLVPAPGEDARRLGRRIEQAVSELADEATTDWWSARRRAAEGTTPRLTGPDDVPSWRRSWALQSKEKGREKPARRWP